VERELLLASSTELRDLVLEDRESSSNGGAGGGLGREANGSERLVGLEEGGLLGHKCIEPSFRVVGGRRRRGRRRRRRRAARVRRG
jgi:hypothetical protein